MARVRHRHLGYRRHPHLPNAVAAGDFSGDGEIDLTVISDGTANSGSMLAGMGIMPKLAAAVAITVRTARPRISRPAISTAMAELDSVPERYRNRVQRRQWQQRLCHGRAPRRCTTVPRR
jgi:hypothetical protein